METSTYPWSRAFGLTRGARRKPIIGNTGPSFGCTVKQIFNEIFFLRIVWWTTGKPTHEQEGKERKRQEKEKREKRACARACKKKRWEFVTLIGDPGHAGRWPRDPSWTEGVRIQDSGTGINEREKYRGTRREWKKRNEPCGAWKESCKFFFFFLTKRGLVCAVQR